MCFHAVKNSQIGDLEFFTARKRLALWEEKTPKSFYKKKTLSLMLESVNICKLSLRYPHFHKRFFELQKKPFLKIEGIKYLEPVLNRYFPLFEAF